MTEQESAAELYLNYTRETRKLNPRYVLDWRSIRWWSSFVKPRSA